MADRNMFCQNHTARQCNHFCHLSLYEKIKIKRCCSQWRSEDVQRRADIQGIAAAMTHLTVQIVPVRVYAFNPTRGNAGEGRQTEKSEGWRRRRKDSVVDFCGAQSLSGAVNLSAGSESKCPHHDSIHRAEWPVTHSALSPPCTHSLRTHSGRKKPHPKPVTWPPSFQPRCYHAPHQRRG